VRRTALISFAISPDGQKFVFEAAKDGKTRLWLRSLDSDEVQPIAGTDNADYPFWSPDSKSLAFFADGQLKRIDIAGGIAQRVASAAQGRGGTWSTDGTILFAPATGQPLYRVLAGGGQAVPATHLDPPRQTDQRVPQFLPDGRHFFFTELARPKVEECTQARWIPRIPDVFSMRTPLRFLCLPIIWCSPVSRRWSGNVST